MHAHSSRAMKGSIIIFSCVVALLLMAIVPGNTKALTKEEERQRSMKRDIELGLLAIEPPVKEDIAVAFDSIVIMAQAEEDRDHLHHPQQNSKQDFPQQPLRMQARKILREPEEDRDHLYHH